jgi:hypothetical protein
MATPDNKRMHGWKEIADHLGVSVRTARRWEAERGLTVHRVGGSSKDAVFADRTELDVWFETVNTKARTGQAKALPASSKPSSQSLSRFSLASFVPLRRTALAWVAVVSIAIGALGWLVAVRPSFNRESPSATPSSEKSTSLPSAPKTRRREPVQLWLSRADGWTTLVVIPDGAAGYVGPADRRSGLILRPKLTQARLLLEISRGDGKPVKADAPGPLTVVLEPGMVVDVMEPFPFKVEWQRVTK